MTEEKTKTSFLERSLPGIIIGGYVLLSATAIGIRGHLDNTRRTPNSIIGYSTYVSDCNKDGIADNTEIVSTGGAVSMPIFYNRKPTQEEIKWYSEVTKKENKK
jgi:hypothetical protein